jgi:nucleoside-diphosphate-sugar epimerase
VKFLQDKMLEAAVTGTRNVLNACSVTKVKKVIAVSSIAAVMLNPNWPKDQAMNEESWSDFEFCKANEVSRINLVKVIGTH